MTINSEVERILERVAQQVVYCNCATEGPALKRCEHLGVLAVLRRELGPLLGFMNNRIQPHCFYWKQTGKRGGCKEANGRYCVFCELSDEWDAACRAAMGEK